MQVGEETIKWHVKNLFAKLDAGTRKQVVSARPDPRACSTAERLSATAVRRPPSAMGGQPGPPLPNLVFDRQAAASRDLSTETSP